mmetsp:Transcript_13266/g.53551  ORF Transcript_13266/g.53551 Transcript_13266/m.53551 type:complete len:228 (-) Transcript_13266:58-741(-)
MRSSSLPRDGLARRSPSFSKKHPLSKHPPRTAYPRRRDPSLRSSIASEPIVACVVPVPGASPSNAQTSADTCLTESDAKGSPRPAPRNSDSSTKLKRAAILDATRDGPLGTNPAARPGGSRRSAAAPRPRRLRSNGGTPTVFSTVSSTVFSSVFSSVSSSVSSSSSSVNSAPPKPDAAVAYVVVLLVTVVTVVTVERARASTGFVVEGISAGVSRSALSEKQVASSA